MTRITTKVSEEYTAFIFRINLIYSFEFTGSHGVMAQKTEVRIFTTVKAFDLPFKLHFFNRYILLSDSCSG